MTELRTTAGQLLRFGIVGIASNLVLYVAFLLLTANGVGPKVAMTVIFVLGTLQTFVLNKKWSFGNQPHRRKSFVRYVASYASAYLINLAVLFMLVDQANLPHQAVQGGCILFLAAYLFLLQKFWVFNAQPA